MSLDSKRRATKHKMSLRGFSCSFSLPKSLPVLGRLYFKNFTESNAACTHYPNIGEFFTSIETVQLTRMSCSLYLQNASCLTCKVAEIELCICITNHGYSVSCKANILTHVSDDLTKTNVSDWRVV